MTPRYQTARTMAVDANDLHDLVIKHQGNLSAIAKELSSQEGAITRQGVAFRLQRILLEDKGHTLLHEASALRAQYHVTGRRAAKGRAELAQERARVKELLREFPTFRAAYIKLGMDERAFYRWLESLGIKRGSVRRTRKRRTA